MADKKTQRFTFDAEGDGAEVPTLTSLLYKKNVVKTGASGGNSPRGFRQEEPSQILSLDPTVTLNTGQVTQTESNTPAPQVVVSPLASTRAAPAPATEESPVSLKVAPATGHPAGAPTLRTTAPERLPAADATTAGIRYLFGQARMSAALVFRAKDPDTLRLTVAAGSGSDRCATWDGMEIHRRDFTDLLGRLEKFGFAEFSTLGMAGQGNFDRTAFRTAFQAKGNEWVTLVRVQHPSEKDAIVVALSDGSLQAILPGFHSACMGKSAKKAA